MSQTSYPLVTCIGSLSLYISSFNSSHSLINTFYPHTYCVGSIFRENELNKSIICWDVDVNPTPLSRVSHVTCRDIRAIRHVIELSPMTL